MRFALHAWFVKLKKNTNNIQTNGYHIAEIRLHKVRYGNVKTGLI